MRKNKGMVFSTKHEKGIERAVVLILVPTPTGNLNYLAIEWGHNEFGRAFFYLIDGSLVELFGDENLLLHFPQPGFTFELDGTCRELRKEEPKVVLQ